MRYLFFNEKTQGAVNEAANWVEVYVLMMRTVHNLSPKGIIDDFLIASLLFENGFYMAHFLKGDNLGNHCGYIMMDWNNKTESYKWLYKMFMRFHLYFSNVPIQDCAFEEAFSLFWNEMSQK